VSLREEFDPDLDSTFINPEEFGMERELTFVENGVEVPRDINVVWDTEELRRRAIQQGVYLGTVLCFIPKRHFQVQPKPEQVIYSRLPSQTKKESWVVVDIVDAEECYELYLDKLIA
jgi:hypothetical protein